MAQSYGLAGLLLVLAGTAVAEPLRIGNTGVQVEPGGYLDGLAIVDTGGGPHQNPQALADVWLDVTAPRGLGGRLEIRSQVGGPFEGAHGGVFNFNHAFQNLSPSLDFREAYAELRLRNADLRAGIQTFAWGKLDGIAPTDVLNPRDYHDLFVQDFEENKIGIPALQATYYLPDVLDLNLSQLRATLVYVPFAVPSRLSLTDERWFPTSIAPPQVSIPVRNTHATINIMLRTHNDAPAKTFGAGGIGFRLRGVWGDTDWDLYHYSGPYTGPNADLTAELTNPSAAGCMLSADALASLRQKRSVVHMTGGDWAATFGGATIRGEAAVFLNRPYLADAHALLGSLTEKQRAEVVGELLTNGNATVPLGDLFPELDSIEFGVGVDYLYRGFIPLLQLSQVVILDSKPRLLIANPETQVAAVLRKSFWQDRIELDFRGVYAIERGGWFALPRISYVLRDDIRLRLGYLAVGGPASSLLGQFGSNDEVVFQVRYSF